MNVNIMKPIQNKRLVRLAAIATLAITSSTSSGQVLPCDAVNPWASNYYGQQGSYKLGTALNYSPTAYKTVSVTVHVWRHEDGDAAVIPFLSFSDTPEGRQELTDLVEQYTLPYFAQLEAPSSLIPGFSYPDTDIKIRFKVVDVRFIYDTYLYENSWNPTFGNLLTTAALIEDPNSVGTLHVHVGRCGGPNPFAGPPPCPVTQNTFVGDTYAAVSMCNGSIYLSQFALAQYADEMVHELGHALGLRHIYLNPSSTMETCSYSNQAEFLYDVYGTSAADYPSWLSTPPSPPCDVGYALTYYNNLMAVGTPDANDMSLTPLQIGRMHRNLMTSSIAKYGWGYDPVPYPIPQSETWDFPLKFYQDIEIPAGVTLTVQDELHMVPQARIVVHPGGKLVIDGGIVREALYAPDPWRGIEVWGNATEHQGEGGSGYLQHQGLVELINGGVVQGAIIGVRLGNADDPSLTGGVLRMEDTSTDPINIIRNCRTGVMFDPYTALSSNGLAALNNRSTFTHARFEWTEDFDNIHGNNNPIALADLNGVRVSFRACAFEHSGEYPQYSSQLGYGIRAHNSTVWVTNAGASPNVFTGLDHGVHATVSSGSPRLTVIGAQFNSNVCGVYAEGLRYPFIRNNTFTYGDRAVTLDNFPDEQFWEDFHRGIFLTGCNGLRVLNNTLNGVGEPVAETEGIVIGYTTTGSESVRSNTINSITRAYVGEGISANTSAPAAIGLQYLCNSNNGNAWNIWSRIANGSLASQWPAQTIRMNQGWQNVPALNYLDNHPQGGVNDPTDLRVSTQSLITYWHVAAANYAPTSVTGMAAPTLSGPQVLYGCPIIISGGTDQLALQNEVQQAKLAYADLRFLYANLIDGGSTDQVLEEIAEAWPQDYWDLRAYLLSRSPYLSVDALKEAMDKPGFPDAMRAEICIANPEATQRDGFLRWLEFECIAPLPEQLLENIVASWDNRTYRATLEMQMGAEHLRMSEAAYALAELRAEDDADEGTDLAEELADLQALRTAEARYGEAMLLLGRHNYAAARAVIEALNVEHELKGREADERARMLTYIDFLEAVHLDGRAEAQLTPAEIAELEAFIAVEHDKPTQWASHLLCYNYNICRSPYTGDAEQALKTLARPPTKNPVSLNGTLSIHPNPANAWVAVDYVLPEATDNARLIILDLMGRVLHSLPLANLEGQVVLDTRTMAPGSYLVEARIGEWQAVRAEKLIVRP